jgi:hypothetical protein
MDLIGLLVTILLAALVFYGVVWIVNWMALPAPLNMIARVVIGIIGIIFLLGLLFGYVPLVPVHQMHFGGFGNHS